jgi:hypothetical protein
LDHRVMLDRGRRCVDRHVGRTGLCRRRRLIGASAYRLARSPSTIPGVTPAATVLELYHHIGATARQQMNEDASEPIAVQRRAVTESDAPATPVSYGMAPLPRPRRPMPS